MLGIVDIKAFFFQRVRPLVVKTVDIARYKIFYSSPNLDVVMGKHGEGNQLRIEV